MNHGLRLLPRLGYNRGCGLLDGLKNLIVARTAAQMTLDGFLNLRRRGTGICFQQSGWLRQRHRLCTGSRHPDTRSDPHGYQVCAHYHHEDGHQGLLQVRMPSR